MIEAGTVLQQRYRIDRQIGQGGMGAVYIATDERFESVVAIKETLFMDSNFRKAIEREARLLNSLRHTALPRVSDHFEENDSQFLVMEYIQGEDLGHILDEHGTPFSVDDVVKWADQLLDALDFLHNQDVPVIHRDIKPQNLKITSGGQIILLDFGLAKGNPTDAGHHTAAKSIFGYSRNYASLEQIQGTGTDPRSDLYALGATLYHLITAVAPDDALTRAMSVLGGRPDPLRPASSVRAEVPPGVAGVLIKAMDLNADARPNSAAEMRQMFRETGKYEHLADRPEITDQGPAAPVFAQETRLMADATNAGAMPGEAKTEVMPAFISEETSLRIRPDTGSSGIKDTAAGSATIPARKSRRLAPVFAGLVLVGAALAGGAVYLNSSKTQPAPSAEQINSRAPAAAANSNSTFPLDPVDAPAAGMSNTQVDDSVPVEPGTAKPKASAAGTRPAETAKGARPPSAEKPKPGDETIELHGGPDEDMPGDVVVTRRNANGSTTTTRVSKNPTGKSGKQAPAGTGNFPFDTRYMTPEERRKLRKVMRPDGSIIIPPMPPNQQP
jgi:serine/threonine protein kinase